MCSMTTTTRVDVKRKNSMKAQLTTGIIKKLKEKRTKESNELKLPPTLKRGKKTEGNNYENFVKLIGF